MANPQEIAQLFVGGLDYQDWETVYVQHRWQQGWPNVPVHGDWKKMCRWIGLSFGSSRATPAPSSSAVSCAVTGIITNRQVAYTETEHGVQLSASASNGPRSSRASRWTRTRVISTT